MNALEELALSTWEGGRLDTPSFMRGVEEARERGRKARIEEATLRCGE